MKTLTINSPTHLWTLLKRKEELFESNRDLSRFIFVTEKFIKSCQCGSDNKTLMDNSYKNISNSEEIINILKRDLEYDEIFFEF